MLETLRGAKPFRFYNRVPFTAAALSRSLNVPMNTGPESGYVWSILSLGAFFDNGSELFWQSAFFYKVGSVSDLVLPTAASQFPAANHQFIIDAPNTNDFSDRQYPKGTVLLNAGEIIALSGWVFVGLNGNYTANIYGTAIEVPAERVGELFI